MADYSIYLEGEMLQKVRRSIRSVGFCPAASIDPDTNRRRLRPGRVFCCNLDQVNFQILETYMKLIIPSNHSAASCSPSGPHGSRGSRILASTIEELRDFADFLRSAALAVEMPCLTGTR